VDIAQLTANKNAFLIEHMSGAVEFVWLNICRMMVAKCLSLILLETGSAIGPSSVVPHI